MVRFTMNRWWGFVLTLCLLTASFCLLSLSAPATALADTGSRLLASDPAVPGGGSTIGDPDVPMGPGDGKSGWTSNYLHKADRAVSVQEARCVGDATVPSSVVANHLRLLLLSLRGFYLGF